MLLLALFRLGQGFALGGTWDGLASLLALNAPEGKRGWYAMIPQLGAPLGLIVASLLFAFFTASLPAEDFLSWGWRFPFFVAFAINVVALFARLRMVVTPEFQRLFESRDLVAERPSVTIGEQGKTIVIGAFAPLASFALFHMVTVFPLSWVFIFTSQEPSGFLTIEAVAAAVGLIAMCLGYAGRPRGPSHAAGGLGCGDCRVLGFRAHHAGDRRQRRNRVHGDRLPAARPLVRAVVGRRCRASKRVTATPVRP
jgi:MFS family permease